MVATDVYRPAAIEQLIKLGERITVPVFELGTSASPVDIAKQGLAKGLSEGYDAILVDTAGRLQVCCFDCGVLSGGANATLHSHGDLLDIGFA